MVCAYQLLIQGLVLVAQWVSWKGGPDRVVSEPSLNLGRNLSQ